MSETTCVELARRRGVTRQTAAEAQLRLLIEPEREPIAGVGLDLAAERALLAKAQRERIELQNAVTRGELAPVIVLEQVLAAAGARVAGIFDGIPGALRRRSSLSLADLEFVAGEITKARNIVAGMDAGRPGRRARGA